MSKHLILIAGVPATGKSTFARILAGKLHIPFFCKDDLNEIIGEYMTVPNLVERKKLSVASVRVLLHIADGLLSANSPVILESNFKLNEADIVRQLIEKDSCQTLTFVFSGDMHVIFNRFMKRESSDDRQSIHKSHGLNDLDTFSKAVSPLAEFDVGGKRLCIDASDFNLVDFNSLVLAATNFIANL